MFFNSTSKSLGDSFPDSTNFLGWYRTSWYRCDRTNSNKNKILCLINYF